MIEIIWQYLPKDFFEAELSADLLGGRIQIVSGSATFTTSSEPEDARGLTSDVSDRLAWMFDARALVTARNYSLSEPQYTRTDADGRRHATLFVHSVSHGHTVDRVDLIVRDATGRVIGDSKAERMARQSSYVSALAEKCALSPTLRAMIASFKTA